MCVLQFDRASVDISHRISTSQLEEPVHSVIDPTSLYSFEIISLWLGSVHLLLREENNGTINHRPVSFCLNFHELVSGKIPKS